MGNNELYTDKNPKTTIKGLGFKDEKKAKDTLKKIKKKSLTYQKQVVITMYYRAKYHPHKNSEMKKAMLVFEKWMKKNKINYKK
tara:strand:+ start:378 stop:629 length:252 start_codon:yes stop_codon:yes gene_type:complete